MSLSDVISVDGICRTTIWNNEHVRRQHNPEAIRLFSMIQPDDRILVHLSGGRSSMALLHCLHAYQASLRQENGGSSTAVPPQNPPPHPASLVPANSETQATVVSAAAAVTPTDSRRNSSGVLRRRILKSTDDGHRGSKGVFQMGAVVVDLAYEGYDLLPLVNYLKTLGVTLFYEKQNLSNYCSHSVDLCSSLKQKVIYNVAKMHNYNVLALPHNLDDMAASFLSSVFHNGSIQTMEANVEIKDLNLRLIRPLVFCREKTIYDFIEKADLPIMKTVCPICEQSKAEQMRLKEILMIEEASNPNLFDSIVSAISPLLHLSASSDMVLEPVRSNIKTASAVASSDWGRQEN